MATQANFCSLDPPYPTSFSGWMMAEFGVLRVGNVLIIYKISSTYLIQWFSNSTKTRETRVPNLERKQVSFIFLKKLRSSFQHTSKWKDH